MSRKSRIKWRESDSEELARAVRNFNAKIDRIAKKSPEIKNALPEKVSARKMKELINTRQDLKREINALKRFSKRGSEEIVVFGDYNTKVTKWQKTEINRRVGVINRRRKERLKALEDVEVTVGGVKQGYKKGEIGMPKSEIIDLQPMTGLTKSMSQADLKEKYKSVLAQSQSDFFTLRDFRTKANYITGLRRNFNENKIADIIEHINNMPLGEFLDIFQSETKAKFEGLYPGNKTQEGQYIRDLKAVWLPNR